MAKNYPVHRVRTHEIYTAFEAAQVLGAHRQTVLQWIKADGLSADRSKKPWLIRGEDLRAFLGARQSARKQKMALHQIYCFSCKVPKSPAEKMAEYRQETTTSGRLTALCPDCLGVINKIVRRADLDTIRASIDVTVQQANPRLVSLEGPRSNITIDTGAEHNAETQLG